MNVLVSGMGVGLVGVHIPEGIEKQDDFKKSSIKPYLSRIAQKDSARKKAGK